MSLTTPVLNDYDAVFPGEDWFLYWKTSASLWSTKLSQKQGFGRIYAPINWAFHSDSGESFDFADKKPETDLKRLVDEAQKVGKQIVFLLPLGPSPFLMNSGLPSLLARQPMNNSLGFDRCQLDEEGNLIRMFSFFDNRIYAAFEHFLKALGSYFNENRLDVEVWAMEGGSISPDSGFQSFFKDHSRAYEQGLNRYLKAQNKDLATEKDRFDYLNNIRDLYKQCIEENLGPYMKGFFRISYIGSGQEDFFNRLNQEDSLLSYAKDLLEAMSLNVLPSSICLPKHIKQSLVGDMFSQLVNLGFYQHILVDHESTIEEFHFKPMRFFEVYDLCEPQNKDAAHWADLGLWDYLQDNFNWCFSDMGDSEYQWLESEEHLRRIYFFHAMELNQSRFSNLLKTFLSGGNVVLNRSGMSPEFLRRLEAFIIENSLNVEKVNLYTNILNVTLGEGRMVIFEGDKLADAKDQEAYDFWQRLIQTFHISYLPLKLPEGVEALWKVKPSAQGELSFQEVRRLFLYNLTSYKKKMSFQFPSNFKLSKIIDQSKVSFSNNSNIAEVEFQSYGSISLEFGVFSD